MSQDDDAGGRCPTAHAEGVRVTMDRCTDQPPGSSLYERQVWSRWPSGDWYQCESAWLFNPTDAAREQCLDGRDDGRSNVVQIWQCGPTSGPNVKGNQMWRFW